MARKSTKSPRIEPRFDSSDEGLRANRADRLSNQRKKRKKPVSTRRKPSLFRRFILRPIPKLAYWGFVFSLWGGIIAVGIVGFYASLLPSADTWAVPQRPPNMRIVTKDQTLIGNRGLTGGTALRLEDMSPHILQAVIAIEDRRFHAHFGFDPIGFSRAMVRNVMAGRVSEGGSTLTQQLAKNLFLKPERTFGRKVQELILAIWLEANFSKAEILELYLNRVYFGAGAFGIDAASRRYFGKPAKHVTIAEAAMLAGLLKAPSRYSPATNPKGARDRAKVVVQAMQREGYVKPGKVDLDQIKPGENARHFRSGPDHFVADYVAKRAQAILGKVKQDIVVETTIDPYLMTAAHSILTRSLDENAKKRRVSQAALLALAPNGALRAMIGGRDYSQSQFNRAVDAQRQPGSAFKTFVWLRALQQGYQPQSVLVDEPITIGRWKPENYDKKFRGPVTLNDAFARSLNTIAAKLIDELGPRSVAKLARGLGIQSRLTANASLALGTSEVSLLELTASYAPFANDGTVVQPHIIQRIVTEEGKTLYERSGNRSKPVLSPGLQGQMNAMFRSVVEQGTGRNARLKGHVAGGKTGTSQNSRDALFIGHTAHLVTGIWFGNDNNRPTRKLTGGSLPAMAWKEFMQAAHHDLPALPLPGDPAYLASLPANVPLPTFRKPPAGPQTVTAKRSILDLLTGN